MDELTIWVDKSHGELPVRDAILAITDDWVEYGNCCNATVVDLRDACAALLAEVERLREERRWRSTKTEPPSDDQWQVLIYDGRNVDIGSKLDGIGWTHEFGTLEWEAVTHWMPLPATPVEEE